jgi:DNA topoisomerase-6 subunit B
VSFEVFNKEVDWRRYHVPPDAPVGALVHTCSTRIPYKTVGQEYIGDRPEIQKEIRNAAREALRRLGIFLSRKGSAEAVQRKMNIYGKYLPLIARFSQELAGQERPPNYQNLIGEEGETTEVAEAQTAEEETPTENAAAENIKVIEIAQKKIDDEYSGE